MNCAIYTYGGHERGMGHIYQSRALAAELVRDGAEVQFIVPDVPEGLAKLRERGLNPQKISHDLPDGEKVAQIDAHLSGHTIDVAIVDMLESTEELMRYWKDRATLLVSLDDIGAGRIWADLLFNVIHHPERPAQANYREINALNYAVLRPEFYSANQREKAVPERAGKVLVSQGGSDTFGGLVQLVYALGDLDDDVEIHLLVGAAFAHDGPLAEAIIKSGRHFVLQRDIKEMAALVLQMDLAITGGGKTLFELAAVGEVAGLGAGEEHLEAGALARFAVDEQEAAMGLDDVVRV